MRMRPWVMLIAALAESLAAAGSLSRAAKSPNAAAAAPAAATAAPAVVPPGWSSMVQKGAFRAAFPQAPKMETSTNDTEVGQAQTTTWSYEGPGGSTYLAVVMTKFPDKTISGADSARVLKGARDGALNNVNGTLVHETAVQVDGPRGAKSCPGLEYEATGAGGLHISTRLILVGDVMYQIMFVRAVEANDTFKSAVTSFQLL